MRNLQKNLILFLILKFHNYMHIRSKFKDIILLFLNIKSLIYKELEFQNGRDHQHKLPQ